MCGGSANIARTTLLKYTKILIMFIRSIRSDSLFLWSWKLTQAWLWAWNDILWIACWEKKQKNKFIDHIKMTDDKLYQLIFSKVVVVERRITICDVTAS